MTVCEATRVGTAAGVPPQGGCCVSVVIVSWNTRDLLRECLASTLQACQALEQPTEIIVVDNASTDDSVQMMRNEFPQVHIVANARNVGFAAANNQGIRRSCGRYVLLLNPDTRAASDFLRILVAYLESHPAAAAAGPRLLGGSGEQQVSCYPLPTLRRELWRLLHLDRVSSVASYRMDRWAPDVPRDVESIQGACILLRRDALAGAGLLDERFFIYTEEIDLCRRLNDRGWTIAWVPRAVVMHYGGQSTRQLEARMFLELYRSKVEYFRKHLGRGGALAYKAVLLIATLPRMVVPSVAWLVQPSQRGKWRALLRNYSSLVGALPAL